MSVVDVKKFDVFMPALSSTMSEGTIVQWLKQPGDQIKVGEAIIVVQSDKADMDVESFEEGYLATILVNEGEAANVGDPVGIIVQNKDDIAIVSAESPSAPPPSKNNSSPAPSAPTPTASHPVPAPPSSSSTVAKPDLLEIFMPALSSTMTEGKIVEWRISEGDAVQAGDVVMVVESDKADMDVESFEKGYLAHISVDAGDSCPVGDAVAYVAKSEDDIAKIKAWAASKSSAPATITPDTEPPPPAPPSAPPVTASPSSATSAAEKSTHSRRIVNEGRIIASPFAKRIANEYGVDLKYVVGTGPNGRIVKKDVLKAKESMPVEEYIPPSDVIIATPEAKKIAKKEKIDIATIKGTGNFGRITAEDVLRAAGKSPVSVAKSSNNVAAEQVIATPSAKAPSQSEKAVEALAGSVAMNAMQKAVVQNMNATVTVPVFRLTYIIKTRQLDELYAKLKPKGVTMSALLAKAVAIALGRHPIMNAAYADNSIVYRSDINVAMAVSLKDGGLITPTLVNADKVDLYSLSRTWKDLVRRAAEKKLSVSEYSSGTFAISNLGMYGVDQFDAILPPGMPGILAIGASKGVVGLQDNGLIGAHKEMKVTLTADHRHIYGADGANFLKDLCHIIENEVMELLM